MTATDPLLEAWSFLCRRQPDKQVVLGPERSFQICDIAKLATTAKQAILEHPAGLVAIERRRVAVAAANGAGFLAIVLALRALDCAIVLVDWHSRNVGRERLKKVLGVDTWIVHDGMPATVGPCSADDWLSIQQLAQQQSGEREDGATASLCPLPKDTAFIKITSGSTGKPRGVAVTSAAVMADDAALASTMGLKAQDRILAAIPMSHSYGLSSVALPALIRGCAIAVPGQGPLAAMKATRDHGVSFLPTVPAYVRGLTRASRPPRAPSTLRRVITAGAPLAPELAADFRRIYGQPIHVFYGASECGGITYDREGGAGERGSLGTPVDGVQIELEPLSDDDAGQQRGVVCVRSPAVASSYLPDVEETLGKGRFRTADLGQWVDGELYLRGRIDNIINIKGKKIHPGEIEEVLARHPLVSEVVVMPVEDEAGTVLLRALVVPRDPTSKISERILREHCQGELPSHKVPRSIVLLREFPLTERGKIDRSRLSALDVSAESSGR